MLLVKCSRQARALLERAGRQFLRTTIRDAREGERVIFALNKADLADGERQFALQGRLRGVRALAEGEAAALGAEDATSWKYVAEYDAVAPIDPAFDLADVFGEERATRYRRVTVARTLEAEDAALLEDRLGEAPSGSTATASQPTASQPTASQPTASKPTASKPNPSKPNPSKPTPSKPTPSKPTPSKPTASKPTASEPSRAQPPPAKSAHAPSATSRTASASDPTSTANEEADFEMAWILRDTSLSRIRFAVYLLIAFFLGAAIF